MDTVDYIHIVELIMTFVAIYLASKGHIKGGVILALLMLALVFVSNIKI